MKVKIVTIGNLAPTFMGGCRLLREDSRLRSEIQYKRLGLVMSFNFLWHFCNLQQYRCS